EDVTADLLRPWGQNLHVLVGHDPGKLFDVSVLLKAYRLRGQQEHGWFVVAEVTTEQTTTEQHVAELLKALRSPKFRCNELDWRGKPVEGGRRAFVRADPYSENGAGDQPDRQVYAVFKRNGLAILPAQMKASGGVS